MKCKIIQDLLPLYCDKLTSQESNEEIEKHLHDCEECTDIYTTMKQKEDIIKAEDKDIQPLKKVKKKSVIKIIAGFTAGLVLLGTLFAFMFVGVIPASSKDIEISYSGKILEDGSVSIDFDFETDPGHCIGVRGEDLHYSTLENPDVYVTETNLTLYRVIPLPFDNKGEEPNKYSFGYSNDAGIEFAEGDTLNIKFRDKTISYDLKEIAEELGLQ